MPLCKNGKGLYKGTEPSPKGRGYCARHEKINTKKRGRDKKMWVVRSVKLSSGKRSRRWFKVLPKPKKKPIEPTKRKASKAGKTPTKKSKKSTSKRKKLRGGRNSKEALAGQMICDVLRLYIPVYAFTKNGYTRQTFINKLQKKIDLYVLDKQSLNLFDKYPQRKRMYESKLKDFNQSLNELDPEVSVGLREVFLNKKTNLEEHLSLHLNDVMMVLDPEGFYHILKEIGCEKAAVIEVYKKKSISDADLDRIRKRSPFWDTKVSKYVNKYTTMRHPHAHEHEYEVNTP